MTNHPNRAWRTKMRHACAEWLARWNWPADGVSMLTADQLRDLMSQAYQAGYTDGRQSTPRSTK